MYEIEYIKLLYGFAAIKQHRNGYSQILKPFLKVMPPARSRFGHAIVAGSQNIGNLNNFKTILQGFISQADKILAMVAFYFNTVGNPFANGDESTGIIMYSRV